MTDRPNICTPSAQYSNIKFENTGSLENVSQSSHTPDTTQTTNEISPAKTNNSPVTDSNSYAVGESEIERTPLIKNESSPNYVYSSVMDTHSYAKREIGTEAIKPIYEKTPTNYDYSPGTENFSAVREHEIRTTRTTNDFSPANIVFPSGTASSSSAIKETRIRVVETTSYMKPDTGFPQISSYSSPLIKSEIRAIKTTTETSPLDSVFSKVNTSYCPPTTYNGISPKVIEYVLECQRKSAHQMFNPLNAANNAKRIADKYIPVNNDTTTVNNQVPRELPSLPNRQDISIPRLNEAHKNIIPNVRFQCNSPIVKQNIFQIDNLSESIKQMDLACNIGQELVPQISSAIGTQSTVKTFSPKILYTQIIPNTTESEIGKENLNIYPHHFDTSMVPSLETNQAKYDTKTKHSLLLQMALESNPHAYRMCSTSSHNLPLNQFSPIGNSIKPGIPKLSAHEVGDEVGICPVILHPTKQLSSQVQVKSEALIKTIGFAPARSQMTAQAQSRIVTSSFQCSISESQNVSPLIITPSSHVINPANEIVPAKIVPIPSAPAVSHFSVINKTGSYDSIPEYTGIRQSLVSGTPPVYTQSDFARFPLKSYHHKNPVVNPAVIHGPIPGNIEEPCINIPNSQHVFKPIISPRPSILRKRDADGVLRAQKNLIPILTKSEIEECQNIDEASLNRNGYSETGLQIESIMVPQIPPEAGLLPQISALRQSHMMVEISPRKKPRKQLLPVNQEDSPFKIVGGDIEYTDEKILKNEKSEDYLDEDLICNDDFIDGDAEDEAEDDLDDMDLDDDCPADDYDDDDADGDDDDDDDDDDEDDFGNDFEDEYDYTKSDKIFFEEVKASVEVSDESSACIKPKNKRPTLLGNYKNTWRANTHHFQRYSDFKIKETKKQLADMQQAKKWTAESISGWRVRHIIKQFDGMINVEEDIIERMTELISQLEVNITDLEERHKLVELVKDNMQRSKVTIVQVDDIKQHLKKIFDYKQLVEEVVDKHCPKDLKKKFGNAFSKS